MYKILISDKLGAAGLERLDQMMDTTYDMILNLSPDELLAKIPEYDALIVRSGTQVDAALIAAGTNLKVIGRAGMGVDNIDIDTASMHGIIVTNTPTANSVATAEQTMALMLAISRHTIPAHNSVAAGEWRRADFVGTELSGKILGIIGFGNIGRLVAERAIAFGMQILAVDPYVSEAVGREMGVTLVDLEDLLPAADYITLHAAVTAETAGLINAETLAQMKDGVVLINVARGKLIDEAALAAALQAGKVAAAALDVFAQEPPRNSPVIHLPNVIHTPHLGASSREAQREVAIQIVQQVVDALRGTDFRNALNIPFPPGMDYETIRPYLSLGEKLGRLQQALAGAPIMRMEVEVRGAEINTMVRPVAAALLKGLLASSSTMPINLINAPVLAQHAGIQITETTGLELVDYPNLISCRVHTADGQRTLAGVLFAGGEPRIVQVDNYKLDAQPKGVVLILENEDVPGVIGQVGTILAAYNVNIGEWRMGREFPGGMALSFINLDNEPPQEVLQALGKVKAAKLVTLVVL
jgi:D-3-phosphoglycerate dehydrogenase